MDYDNPGVFDGRVLGGDLETLTLQSSLKMLALSGISGVLQVESRREQMRIFLEDGAISSLDEPGMPEPDLIALMRDMGRLGADQIMLIPQDARRELSTVVQYLVNIDAMSPQEELKRREFVVVQALSRAVRWTKGKFEFERDSGHRTAGMYTPSAAQPLNIDHVLLEALRQADEREYMRIQPAPRTVRARKVEPSGQDPRLAGLDPSAMWVYRLCNGERPLYAVAYGLLMPEAIAGAWMSKLLELGVLYPVDARADQEREQAMVSMLTQTRTQLQRVRRDAPPPQVMLELCLLMGTCANGMLQHFGQFALSMRSADRSAAAAAARYVDETMMPVIELARKDYPRTDGIIHIEQGQLLFEDIKGLDRVVRGQELLACYWDSVRMLHKLLRVIYDQIALDEVGPGRVARYNDLWVALLGELDNDMRQLYQWYSNIGG